MNQFQAPGESHIYGGGFDASYFNPVYLIVLLAAIALIWILPRKHMVVPFVFAMFLIPTGEQVYLLGGHWSFSRLLVIAVLGRIATLWGSQPGGLFGKGFTNVDYLFLGSMACQAVCFVIRNPNGGAVAYQGGFVIDQMLGYCVVRVMIRDEADLYRSMKALTVVILIVGAAMLWEQVARQNVFGMLGGTQAAPSIREGKIRSQGAFQHALTAGTFGATFLPCAALLWKVARARMWASLALFGCTLMTVCSNSSTPLLAWAAGLGAVFCWPARKMMRPIRRATVALLIMLHIFMQAPVWFLIARIDLTGGSSGYHRAELVNQFIIHFNDWWLFGTDNAGNWGWDLWDQQNQLVGTGEAGGLLALVLLIGMLKAAYARLGSRRREHEGTMSEWTMWLLGAALFANLVAFFGLNYFDQIKVSWYLLLCGIIAVTEVEGRPAELKPAAQAEQWWGAAEKTEYQEIA